MVACAVFFCVAITLFRLWEYGLSAPSLEQDNGGSESNTEEIDDDNLESNFETKQIESKETDDLEDEEWFDSQTAD